MLKAIVYLIGFMLVMSVIRSVLGIVGKAFSGLSDTSSLLVQILAVRMRIFPRRI